MINQASYLLGRQIKSLEERFLKEGGFTERHKNDYLVVNQFTVVKGQSNRRPDIVVFVNGIPSGVIELKNPSDKNATIKDAFNEITSLFPYNEILIVRDMWLTGFDAPSLHTMYVDKPIRGHGFMQAIARVNRVFKDKPGGKSR